MCLLCNANPQPLHRPSPIRTNELSSPPPLCSRSNGEDWFCECAPLYAGRLCQFSACERDPCSHGATCIPKSPLEAVCLCPYGRQGLLCDERECRGNGRLETRLADFFFLMASLGGRCAKGQIKSGGEIKGLMKPNCAEKAKKEMSSRSQIAKAEDTHLLLYEMKKKKSYENVFCYVKELFCRNPSQSSCTAGL